MTTIIDLSSDDETPPAPKPQGMSVASTQQHKTYQRVRKQQHCQASKTQPIEIKDDNLSQLRLHQKDLDFIDHVVMIWLHRARKGYKNIEMPDDILKAKANEAVNVMKLDKSLFCENTWIMGFHEKLKKLKESKQMIEYGKSKMFKIEAIIDAENSSFYRNYDENKFKETKRLLKETHKEKLAQELKEIEDTQQKQLENMLQQQKKHLEWVKEAQKQQIARIKYAQKIRLQKEEEKKYIEWQKEQKLKQDPTPATVTKLRFGVLCKQEDIVNIAEGSRVRAESQNGLSGSEQRVTLCETIKVEDVDVLDEPIKSYEEVLDCLVLVENYFLSSRNLKAAMFVDQIETFVKQQLNS